MLRPNDILLEGMRAGDLTDLVLSLISVDEFESKIDKDAIVIGFYVVDKDAADDLNRFIQRSPVEILDSDISPAPDQNGHYMVFVELLNNKQAADNIVNIAEEITALCDIDHWDAQIRGHSDTEELQLDSLTKALNANREHDRKNNGKHGVKESIETILSESDLADLVVLDSDDQSMICISLNPLLEMQRFSVVDYQVDGDPVMVREGLDLSFEGLSTAKKVQRALGPNWDVDVFGDLQRWRRNDNVCLLVRPLN